MAEIEPNFEKSEVAERSETAPKPEAAEQPKSSEVKVDTADKQAEIDQIEAKAKQEAKSSTDTVVEKAPATDNYHAATGELKTEALKRSLTKVRKQLPAFDRSLSKVIHKPSVDFVSKAAANTVVRPRGVLLGALVALGGSGYLLYSAKHYGYTYNYLVVVLLFVAGYIVGLLLDLVLAIFKRSSK